MTADDGARAVRAFERHEAFEERDAGGDDVARAFAATTTPFDGVATIGESGYELVVRMPTLAAAVDGEVGPAVAEGWLETLERRLEDAPKATRASVDVEAYELTETDGEVVATYRFATAAANAPDVAKAMVEYAEGTYVEGVVPGYDYREPVAGLVGSARQGGPDEGEGDRGPMPL